MKQPPQTISEIKVGDPNQPNLDLEIKHLFCQRHGEPFRQFFPHGLQYVTHCFLEFLKQDPKLWDESGGVLERIPNLLEPNPFCCRLTKGQLFELYRDSMIGTLGLCRHCRQTRLGAPYRCLCPNNIIKTYVHICFECIVERSYDHLFGLKITERELIVGESDSILPE